MERERQQDPPRRELDRPVIVHHKITVVRDQPFRFRPAFSLVIGPPHHRDAAHAAAGQSAFFEIKKPDRTVLQPQQGNAHDIGRIAARYHHAAVFPGRAAVLGNRFRQIGGGMVSPARAGVAGVDETDPSILREQESPLGVARIVRSVYKFENTFFHNCQTLSGSVSCDFH